MLAVYALTGLAAIYALPAKRGFTTHTQPDGTTVTVSAVGDEFGHYFIDREGTAMMLDNDGYIRPATKNRIESLRSRAKTRRTEQAAKRVQSSSRAASSTGSVYHGLGHFSDDFPRLGKVKILVFLVEYTDVKFKTQPSGLFQPSAQCHRLQRGRSHRLGLRLFHRAIGRSFRP